MVEKIFDKYDKDNSGSLEIDEIELLMGDIYAKLGKSKKPSR